MRWLKFQLLCSLDVSSLPWEASPSSSLSPFHLCSCWEFDFQHPRTLTTILCFFQEIWDFLTNISVLSFSTCFYLSLAINSTINSELMAPGSHVFGQVGILLLQKTFQLTHRGVTSSSGSNKAIICWMIQCQYFLEYSFLIPSSDIYWDTVCCAKLPPCPFDNLPQMAQFANHWVVMSSFKV